MLKFYYLYYIFIFTKPVDNKSIRLVKKKRKKHDIITLHFTLIVLYVKAKS